jgi:hypothetical protein
MTTRLRPEDPRPCNRGGSCEVLILLAHPPGNPERWVPYDAQALDPDCDDVSFCHVLVGSQATRRRDLIEKFAVDRALGVAKAEELVAGYPHHRRHFHPHDDDTTDTDRPVVVGQTG